MIYTVTFNPSIDYITYVSDFIPDCVNRTDREVVYPGGKGINVSVVLSRLGVPNKAFGFTAGFTGDEVERLLQKFGCYPDFIKLEDGLTRINVKVKSKQETEINGQGPAITSSALEMLYQKLDQLVDGDILVLAGSIPNTLPSDIYEQIMAKLACKNVRVVVDATKQLLLNVLKYHPFLIKPNHHELGEMFGVTLHTQDEIVRYAKKLQELGARNVMISMAKDGGILLTENGAVYQSEPPKGKVVNSVGAGDSMVAGFLAGYLNTGDYAKAFQLGLVTGSATAFQEWLADKNDVLSYLKHPEEFGL
ncbi:MAG: 1-phosphofructokinase [Clostridiales bacterium]|nr:1-phosphofructokinase [Clostridiales bacterium]